MAITEIRRKLHDYIDELDDEEAVILYSELIEGPGKTYRRDWWNDEELIAEMDRRVRAIEDGTDKGFTLEESREHLLKRIRKS